MTGPVILVVGARPNFMKIAPIHAELERRGINQILLHTGQHYDENMSKVFFDDLGMPQPDIYLGIGSCSHATQTAKVMVEFEKVCKESYLKKSRRNALFPPQSRRLEGCL